MSKEPAGPTTDTVPEDSPLVFVSHSSEDAKYATELRRILTEDGFSVWMAPEDIRGSRPWAEQILNAISNAMMLVVLVSSDANESAHVGREVNLALDQGKPVLPVRIEDVAVSGTLHYLLALVQWVDAFPPPLRRHRDRLNQRIAGLLAEFPDPPKSAKPSPESREWLNRPWVAAGGALLVVLGGAAAYFGLGLNEPFDHPEDTTTPTMAPEEATTVGANGSLPQLPAAVTTVAEAMQAVREVTPELGFEQSAQYRYIEVATQSGSFSGSVPVEWTDREEFGYWIVGFGEDEMVVGDTYIAAFNITNFYAQKVAGVFVGIAAENPEPERNLGTSSNAIERGCTAVGPTSIDGPEESGLIVLYYDCAEGPPGSADFELSRDGGYVSGTVFIYSDADLDAFTQVVESTSIVVEAIGSQDVPIDLPQAPHVPNP